MRSCRAGAPSEPRAGRWYRRRRRRYRCRSGRADRRRDCDRRGIRSAAPECRDPPGLRVDALEAGDHGDLLAVLETLHQLRPLDVEDPRRSVGIAGLDRDLPALPGAGLNTHVLQHDRKQPRGDLLARRHHGVIFARIMQGRGFAAPLHQLVGPAGHGRDHHGHIVAGVDLALHMARDIADAFDVGDGCAAEFHHEAAHDEVFVPSIRYFFTRGKP